MTAFFGVPYAAQPVGPRRFRPPAPVEAWAGVLNAERRDITATAAEAEYVVDGDALLAESGTVTITQYSASRVQGEFDFEGDDGVTTVTGQFDVSY